MSVEVWGELWGTVWEAFVWGRALEDRGWYGTSARADSPHLRLGS